MSPSVDQAILPHLPVDGDILDEVGRLRVRHHDAFGRHRQRYFTELLGAGSGL